MTGNFDRNSVIIDSYAWIEYFNGTQKGAKARKIIESTSSKLYTVDVCLAEIKFWALSENKDFQKLLSIILSNSTIMNTNSDDWLKAADIKFEKRKHSKNFGLVDAIIISKSLDVRSMILTGDKHFGDEPQTMGI